MWDLIKRKILSCPSFYGYLQVCIVITFIENQLQHIVFDSFRCFDEQECSLSRNCSFIFIICLILSIRSLISSSSCFLPYPSFIVFYLPVFQVKIKVLKCHFKPSNDISRQSKDILNKINERTIQCSYFPALSFYLSFNQSESQALISACGFLSSIDLEPNL